MISPSPRRRFVPGFAQNLLRRIFWKSYASGLTLALVLGGGGYYAYGRAGADGTAASATATQAARRSIVSSVKAAGEVTFANEQELRFNQKGKVTAVYKKEGDRVTRGTLIAQLDASSVLADIRQAQLSIGASSLQLQQLQGSKEKTVLDAQNAVKESERQFADAQNALAVAQQKLPTDIAGAERSVQEKEAAVEQAKAALAQAKATTVQDLASTAQDILTKSEDQLDGLYGLLVHDASARHTYGNTAMEIYSRLYIDQNLKNTVERDYNAALQAVDGMRGTYGSSLATLRDTKKVAAALTDARKTAEAVHKLAESTYAMLQGATDDPKDFTVADINAAKQTAIASRTAASGLMTDVDTALAGLTGGKDGPTSIAIQQKQDALASAQNALLDAQENLEVLRTQTPGDLAQQQAALQKIQEDYASKKLALAQTAKNSDVDYKLKQNDISQKATSLQKTRAVLEDYQLTAPFDGVIRRLDYQVGDNLLDTGEEKFAVLENPDALVVTILLDQVDIVRVRKGMAASIVFDALPGQTFQGTIDEIDSTPQESSGVVSYEVSIRMPTPKDLTILSGMTTTVVIETTRKDDVVTVPNLALKRANGTTTVQTADGRTVEVQTGATDGRYTEIVSGLTEGQSVLATNVTVSSAGTANQQNAAQIFRMGGGGGGFAAPAGGGGGNVRTFQR